MNRIITFILLLNTLLYSQSKDVTLLLPWKHQFQFAGYYVAKELGYYESAGLNVNIKEYNLKRSNTKDVANDRYEFGVGHSSLILDKLNEYPDIMLLNAIHQSSPLILLSKKRSDLTTIADFADKKIMMSRDQTYTASINAMLSSEHLKADSYRVIDTSFHPIDLINGNADLMIAYSSNEPYTLKEKGIDYTIFDPKDYDYDFYSDILFTSSTMIKNNPKDVETFYRASMRGWQYAYSHIDESVEIILKHYNTQSRSKKALLYEAHTLKKLAFKDGVNFGDINPQRIKEMVNTYRLLGLVKENRKIDFNSFIYRVPLDFDLQERENSINKNSSYLDKLFEMKYLKLFLFILLLIVLIGFFFKKRGDKIIALKTTLLNKQNEIFHTNVSSSKTDLDGVITYASQAFCKASGYNESELLGQKHNIIKDKETPMEVYKDLWLTITSGHTWSGELKNIKKDGSEYWVNTLISPIFDKNENIIAYEAIREDITLKKVLKEFNTKLEYEVELQTKELQLQAQTDKLTGIFNRDKLDKELEYHHKSYLRYKRVYSLILIDIDFFKKINDTFGHQVGDSVLIKTASLIKSSIRSTDIFGRWGGEEFMIISPETDVEGAYQLCEHIRQIIQEYPFEHIDGLSISAGVAQVEPEMSEQNIILKSDKALYRAKDNGRNRVEK